MYLTFLIFIFINIPLSNPFILSKYSSKEFECIADYLLLNNDKISTEVFAENIHENWIVQRGIPEKVLKDIYITKQEMEKIMGDEYANNCFVKINKLNWFNSEDLKVEHLLNAIKEKHLILSENYQKKLEEQLFCLANFLVKINEEFDIIEIPDPLNKINYLDVINDHFRFYFMEKYHILRLNKKSIKHIISNKETKKFNELYECYEILKIRTDIYKNTEGVEYIYLSKMFKRFNPNQIYFNKVPRILYVAPILYHFEDIIIEEKNVDCSICLAEFEVGEEAKKLNDCNHIFHQDCIQGWIDNVPPNKKFFLCPLCRHKYFIATKVEENNVQKEKHNSSYEQHINEHLLYLLEGDNQQIENNENEE